MKVSFRYLILISAFFSCSKKSATSDNTAPGNRSDTLSAGWTIISSLPVENFTDIFFVDNTTGYAVSNNGAYRSVNSGDTWTKINNSSGLVNVAAGTPDRAIFLNNSPSIFVTADGGNSITNPVYPNPGGGNPGFFDCFFSSANVCYLSSSEYIWKSADAGQTIDSVFRFPNTSTVSSLFFLNDQEGWVLRLDGLYQTVNGGNDWNIDTSLANAYGSVDFLDSDNGYFSNYGTVNKTTDAGITWLPVFTAADQSFGSLDFVSVNEGYVSLGRRIYKTIDAGTTWTPVVSLGGQFIGKIHFTDANHGWASTSDGTIVRFAQ